MTSPTIIADTAAGLLARGGMTLADALQDPQPCLPPGFAGPVSTALGWVKALGLVIAIIALIRIGAHMLRQQGDGVPDRDDTFDKIFNWVIGALIVGGAFSFIGAIGLSVSSC